MQQVSGIVWLLLLLPVLCPAQAISPEEVLAHYLDTPHDRQAECSKQVYAMDIDASLPKLKKSGRMSGLKVITQTGQTVYQKMRFTGDNLVKTAVIERFLRNEANTPTQSADQAINRQNYSLEYDRTADYNGHEAYVYRLKPTRKRVGLLRGELWLEAGTGAPLRLWGDFVKSPSLFVRSFRVVLDYQNLNQCLQPYRLLITVGTRIVGAAEMAVWLHPTQEAPTPGQAQQESQALQ